MPPRRSYLTAMASEHAAPCRVAVVGAPSKDADAFVPDSCP
ncbi:hypothetical protein BZL30_2322 [Mycobacterium kansasii]|uniref:Uncharacterized protein n=1 Tax=Mycobacterium kansasii TaxID=1768 RepID=A0A1V3XK72_MYCKA|nr:hypothetical protein BZL30_2322 [Mycobacterium kansasii]